MSAIKTLPRSSTATPSGWSREATTASRRSPPVPRRALSGDGRYVSTGRIDFADPVVERIGDVDILIFVDGDTVRGMECGVEGGTVVTLESGAA